MVNFNLEKTAIYLAVKWAKFFELIKVFKKVFGVFSVFLLIFFIYGLLAESANGQLGLVLGSFLISLVVVFSSWIKEMFFESKLKKPKLKHSIGKALANPERFNLADFLSFEAAKAVFGAKRFVKSKKLAEINSSILTFFLLKENPRLNFILSRILLSSKTIKEIYQPHFKSSIESSEVGLDYSEDFFEAVLLSLGIAKKKGHLRIEKGDLLTALAEKDLILKKILRDLKIKIEDIENLTWWLEYLERKIEESKKFWRWENLIRRGSLAKDWASGYTITLDQFSTDWSEIIKIKGYPEIIGHQQEIEMIERILSRREINNVLLIGEPGIGKRDIVLALSKKSLLDQSLPEVNSKRVVQLDLALLLTQTESNEEVELILDRIFQEAVSAGNIVLVIDDFHNYFGKKAKPGMVNIAGIISKYLHLPQFQIVALTNFLGFHRTIERNPSILSLFEKVEVSEISKRETLMNLEELTLTLESKYKKFVSYLALRDIIDFCEKHIEDVPFPKKALDLLDEAMIALSATKDKILLPKHIAKVFSEKTKIPVGEIRAKEKDVLLNLEDLIHQRIINQEEAVGEISAALRRARSDITIRKGPMGAFLFLGPTGVGKTETAKALAEIYFSSEDKMIRFDMSEYQSLEDLPRLIGSADEGGFLATKVREEPFSLLLLDEFEKADSNILNLFLQVFDEGYLTDGLGRKISFKNTIIIATSNAGFSVILEAIEKNIPIPQVKEDLLNFVFKNNIFRPELINRFDGVIVFKPLTKDNLLKIAELLLLKSKKNLKEKDIDLVVTPQLKEKIVQLGYDPRFGAREMRRVIQDKIENLLAKAILKEELKPGDRIEIDPEEFKLIKA